MNFKTFLQFTVLMTVVVSFALLSGCGKDDDDDNNNNTPKLETGQVSDVEGNSYKTVKIGSKWWMSENLNVTKYRNGDDIGTTTPSMLAIPDEQDPKYQWVFDGMNELAPILGRLYTSYAMTDSRGLCPTGWHVATVADWDQLITHLGGESVAGGKLKMTGSTNWLVPNTGATNESGFTAIPAGKRLSMGNFIGDGYYGCWWVRDPGGNHTGQYVYYDNAQTSREGNAHRNDALSIRCVKD